MSSLVHSLSGQCIAKNEDAVVISIVGIGIVVWILKKDVQNITIGQNVSLLTWLYPQSVQLFGFVKEEELRLFELLNLVSGIGPRGAMKILNNATVQDIQSAIVGRQTESLAAVCSLSLKMASKIIIELNERLKKEGIIASGVSGTYKEVEQVLSRLGYSRADIKIAMSHIKKETTTIEEQVRQALKALATNK